MGKNKETAGNLALNWWHTSGSASAACDKCGASIPYGKGYLCKPYFAGMMAGGSMTLVNKSPDLLCEACFDCSTTAEPVLSDTQDISLKKQYDDEVTITENPYSNRDKCFFCGKDQNNSESWLICYLVKHVETTRRGQFLHTKFNHTNVVIPRCKICKDSMIRFNRIAGNLSTLISVFFFLFPLFLLLFMLPEWFPNTFKDASTISGLISVSIALVLTATAIFIFYKILRKTSVGRYYMSLKHTDDYPGIQHLLKDGWRKGTKHYEYGAYGKKTSDE